MYVALHIQFFQFETMGKITPTHVAEKTNWCLALYDFKKNPLHPEYMTGNFSPEWFDCVCLSHKISTMQFQYLHIIVSHYLFSYAQVFAGILSWCLLWYSAIFLRSTQVVYSFRTIFLSIQ